MRAIAGDLRAVSRLLTRVESGEDGMDEALELVFRHAGRAHVVGITGVPGAGKSSMVARIAARVRTQGRTIAILAIDPSSTVTGGAILGDRIRMADLGGDSGVYIRSMATRGGSGGLARSTLEAINVLDAAGFDMILVETVGVGQDELDICHNADTTIVVSAPGLGDSVQAIKAGILELADIHVVNKADRPDAQRTLADLAAVVHLVSVRRPQAWTPPVLATSAEQDRGIGELLEALDRHREAARASGEAQRRREAACLSRLWKTVEDIAVRKARARSEGRVLEAMLQGMASRAQSPRAMARALLDDIR